MIIDVSVLFNWSAVEKRSAICNLTKHLTVCIYWVCCQWYNWAAVEVQGYLIGLMLRVLHWIDFEGITLDWCWAYYIELMLRVLNLIKVEGTLLDWCWGYYYTGLMLRVVLNIELKLGALYWIDVEGTWLVVNWLMLRVLDWIYVEGT